MNNFLLSIILLFSINSFAQTTYYVDATNGNDSNNGTTSGSAWRSIRKVNKQSFSPGDVILFKRGEVWRGKRLEISGYSGEDGNVITFGAYPSTGLEPIITAITKHSHSWINEGNNIWKATNPPSSHPERLLKDETEILRANKLTELDGKNFFWLYDAEDDGDLYLYSETDPGSVEISYADGFPIIIEDASYITITNINLQGGWTNIYIVENTNHINLVELDLGKYARDGININSETSAKPQNIIIRNCNFDAFFEFDFSMAATSKSSADRGVSDGIYIKAAAEHCEIYDNYFKNWGHASIDIDGEEISYISVHDNYLTSPDICYGGRIVVDDAQFCEVYNNEIINTSVQSQLNGRNCHYHHNIFDGTTNPPLISNNEEISAGIDVDSYSKTDVENNIYENNIIKNTEGAGFQISASGDYDIHNIIVRNNIIYNCGTVPEIQGIGILIHHDTEDSHTYNNIFCNNLIYNESTSNTIDFRGNITDIAGFYALTGTSQYQIADNIAENPLFVDVNNADYHLTENSPCIDAGITTLATHDFEGNEIPYNETEPDIGIYESQFITSVYDCFYSDDIIVYPNPATDFIKISVFNQISVSQAYLINSNGQIIKIFPITDFCIEIKNIEAGIYFVRIESHRGIINKKIIKI